MYLFKLTLKQNKSSELTSFSNRLETNANYLNKANFSV